MEIIRGNGRFRAAKAHIIGLSGPRGLHRLHRRLQSALPLLPQRLAGSARAGAGCNRPRGALGLPQKARRYPGRRGRQKKKLTNGKHRVIYHAHTTNTIALTFVLPLDDKIFTRELWESATECPVVFPDGGGVVGWMVPGGREIAIKTAELMKKYDVVIWAHHGMFCSGEDFDLTFGLLHTVEKSAEILVKILSMTPNKLQTITPDNFRSLAKDFKVSLPEEFLYEKQ